MTDSQDQPVLDDDQYALPPHLIVSKADIAINYFLFFGSLGAFTGGLITMHAGIIVGFGIILFVYVLRIIRNFFYIFAPRLPSYRSMVREAYIARDMQQTDRTITQDDAMNYAVGGIAVGMPWQDFDEPF